MYTYLNIFLIVSGKRQLKNNHQGALKMAKQDKKIVQYAKCVRFVA